MNVYVDVVGVIVCMLIDFVVIGGYFGVGKMMVVNVILQVLYGWCIVVFVNDFGVVNIDVCFV